MAVDGIRPAVALGDLDAPHVPQQYQTRRGYATSTPGLVKGMLYLLE